MKLLVPVSSNVGYDTLKALPLIGVCRLEMDECGGENE